MVKHKGYLLAIYIFCLNVDIRVNLYILWLISQNPKVNDYKSF